MEDETIDDFCLILKSGTSLVLDLTLKGQQLASSQALGSAGVPYLHLDSSNRQFVLATADFLAAKRAINAVLVMPSKEQVKSTTRTNVYFKVKAKWGM